MSEFAKEVGLDLHRVTPDLLEALHVSLEAKSAKVMAYTEHPKRGEDSWLDFMHEAIRSDSMTETLHKLAHAIEHAPDCSKKVMGMLIAMLFGFEMAIALVEGKELAKVETAGPLSNYKN